MALKCIDLVVSACYRVPRYLAEEFSPEGRLASFLGGGYETDAPVLRGSGICGGPLDFQKRSTSGG